MFRPGFEWDDDNIEHIARHGVEPWEAEEAALDSGRSTKDVYGGRRGLIGATEDGRLLVVVYELKGEQRIRVVTARAASERDRRIYRRRSR